MDQGWTTTSWGGSGDWCGACCGSGDDSISSGDCESTSCWVRVGSTSSGRSGGWAGFSGWSGEDTSSGSSPTDCRSQHLGCSREPQVMKPGSARCQGKPMGWLGWGIKGVQRPDSVCPGDWRSAGCGPWPILEADLPGPAGSACGMLREVLGCRGAAATWMWRLLGSVRDQGQ